MEHSSLTRIPVEIITRIAAKNVLGGSLSMANVVAVAGIGSKLNGTFTNVSNIFHWVIIFRQKSVDFRS